MSQSRYDAYKDSGVAWLGQVPAHWEVVALKRTLDIQNGHDYKHIESENGYPVIGSGGIFAFASDYLFDGESILLGRKGTIDKPLHFRGKFWTVDTMFWSKIATGVYGRFIYYVATEIPFAMYSTNTALPSMAKSVLEQHLIPLPPLAEQQALAAFLDRECARIDALVAAQQRMIALSKEKRQALISQAVTRGLDPATPYKDSGVAWLGRVPAHWEVRKIKDVVSQPITDGPHETPEFQDDGVVFISAEAVSSGKIDFGKKRGFISHSVNEIYLLKYKPQLLDIYMIKSGATTGVTAICEDRVDFNIWSPLAAIRCNNLMNPYYLLNFMRSINFQDSIKLFWTFGTQQNIGMGTLSALHVLVPPLAEQQAIAAFLDRECARIDTLIERAEQAIVLLRERRSALIAAAVTGQIRVDGAE